MSIPAAALLLGCLATAQVKDDETVVFYPCWARQAADGSGWEMDLHGRIFEAEEDSQARAGIIAGLKLALGGDWGETEERIFARRIRGFLTDSERGKVLQVRIAGREAKLDASQANGHFSGRVVLGDTEAARAAAEGGADCRAVRFEAVLAAGDSRRFRGVAHLIAPQGVSVISDIDDTIKISEVRDRKALLANTFCKDFRPVPGLSDIYNAWSAQGASFHYVSASPWQLYEPLAELTGPKGYPEGVFHLKSVRFTDATLFDLFASPEGYKAGQIEPLFKAFPRRQFVLVGDTGEKDPEIYGELARKHAAQIRWILIRDVTKEDRSSPRLRQAFEGIPEARWRVFREAAELKDIALGEATGSL